MNLNIERSFVLGLTALWLSACGGNGSYNAAPSTSDSGRSTSGASTSAPGTEWSSVTECPGFRAISGIEGGGRPSRPVIKGVIERLAADGVVVDGVQYSAVNASVVINGSCGAVTDLLVGHVVTVVGEADLQTRLGTADRIVSDDDVAGGILALDADHGTLNVIGQNIVVTPETIFGDSIRPASLATLGLRDQVAVSGRVDTDGTIVATRIDRWPAFSGWHASGVVSALDETKGLFHLNQIPVRYVDAAIVGFPANRIGDGDTVRVQGMPLWVVLGYGASNGGINADAIEYVDYFSIAPGVLISGMITRWVSSKDFDINGHPITADLNTAFTGLLLSAVLLEGTEGHWLTVFGPMDDRGVIHARVIETENSANLGLQGPVTGLDSEARIVQVLNVPVEVSTSTLMTQRDAAGSRAIGFGDLNLGSGVSLAGFTISYRGHVAAMRIEQGDPSNQVSLQHWHNVRLAHEPTFPITIGSTTLTVEATADTQFYYGHTLANGCSCSRRLASGFWAVKPNPGPWDYRAVQVFGTWNGDHIIADRIYWLED